MIKYSSFNRLELTSFLENCKSSKKVAFIELSLEDRRNYFCSLGFAYIPLAETYRDEKRYIVNTIKFSAYHQFVVEHTSFELTNEMLSLGKSITVLGSIATESRLRTIIVKGIQLNILKQ